MESQDDLAPTFCIGQHETRRTVPVSPQLVQLAQEGNYDLLTTPITTPLFHSRVLTLLSTHLSDSRPPVLDATLTLGTSHNTSPVTVPPLSPEDTFLTPNESTSQLVGVTSPWIDLCSPDPLIADISRQVLNLEIAYAAFCGVSFVIIPGPRLHHGNVHGEGLMYYARAVQDILNIGLYIQVHIWFGMVDIPDLETNNVGDLAPFARADYLIVGNYSPTKVDLFGTWEAWDVIRKNELADLNGTALSIPKHLPPMSVQARWHAEQVHILTIAGSSFIKNQKGFPVLPKAHQAMIARMMQLRTPPWIILCDVGPIPGLEVGQSGFETDSTPRISPRIEAEEADPTPAEAHRHFRSGSNKKNFDPTPHLSYMRNLQQKQPSRTPMERFGVGYQDYLQAPLQPLTVNLESITYEVFEKDPIKYEWYERAIAKALKDWAEQGKPTCHPEGHVVLAVVGAGRGPLVTRAIRASVETGVAIEVWVVEKNPNAFVLLQRHNEGLWGGCVNLVKSDMRSWKGPHRLAPESGDSDEPPKIIHTPIDILVSELLGSFGDNELSPECLDGVTHLLNPVHGISIPASYSAHLSPISSPRLHADIANQSITNPAAPETPYVVMLHAFDFLSTLQQPVEPKKSASANKPTSGGGGGGGGGGGQSTLGSGNTSPPRPSESPTPIIKAAWSFSHPNINVPPPSPVSSTISNAHNVRRTRLAFPCRERGTCHGLAGYFETVLYDDVELSTNPVTMDAKSAGMISWFPIYFPLKTPLTVPANSEIVVTMYRQTDNRKVWYEWIVEVFARDTSSPLPAATTSSASSQPQQSSPPTSSSLPLPLTSPSQSPTSPPARAEKGTDVDKDKATGDFRRVRVAMSELHSSIKDGCLM
ncbi:shk1 kinase-binding protein [Histoplasma capsulatum var. duboisii H88]|uniref:Shk1 kinase-binding protein n=1 Tax=Ajellomyces capsulatus (strain H88) TaxID=544711 RepID=F0UMT5_AJEC8|nr:shk1 kinase-binding protein [Histoplasma capsulatum var. duboisii H88]